MILAVQQHPHRTEQSPLMEERPSIVAKICQCMRCLLPTFAFSSASSERNARPNIHTLAMCGPELHEYSSFWAYTHQYGAEKPEPLYYLRRVPQASCSVDLSSGG